MKSRMLVKGELGAWRGPIFAGLLALAVLLLGFFLVVQASGGVQQLAAFIDQMKAQLLALGEPVRDWVASTGPWAPLTYFVSKALIFIFIPAAGYPLTVASGALFGLFWGLTLTILGDTLGGCALFLLSRRVGRPAVARLLGKSRMSRVDRVLDVGLGGWQELLFVRVIVPVPFNLVALAGGLVPTLRLRHVALIISMTELTKIYLVGIGAGLATGQWVPIASAIGLSVLAVAALLTRRRVRKGLMRALRWRRQARNESEDPAWRGG
jgi:uncharacterized membrane protein YdjX (TVP38/TMEM64 family)